MPVARTHSIALVGVEGHPVEIEADIQNGLPGLLLVGLPDTALREARDRIRAAIVNSREQWPQRRITVGLSPASLPKRGSGFDIGIAVAILGAAGSVPAAGIDGVAFLGELGLDGQLRPVRGVLPAARGRGGQRLPVRRGAQRQRGRGRAGPRSAGAERHDPAGAAQLAAGDPGSRPVPAACPGPRGRPAAAGGLAGPLAPAAAGNRPVPRRVPGPTWLMCWASRPRGGPRKSAPRVAITSACSGRRAPARPCSPSGFPPCCPASTPPRRSRSPRSTR